MRTQTTNGWDPPRSIVVLHDLSPQAGHAAWRAGMIARDHGADVCLLHASSLPALDPRVRPALERLAAEMAGHLAIQVDVRIAPGEPLAAAVRAAREAGLVVMGSGRGNALRERVFGTQAERLIRLCGRPVLVVKKAAMSGYRRVLVPVDFGPATCPSIAAATALSRSTRIEVFHSLSAKDDLTIRAADIPEADVRKLRQRSADRTRLRLAETIGAVPAAALAALPSVGFGDATTMVLAKEQAMRADLVVIGKRRRGLLADFFLGGVTQRVLAGSKADVLVFPVARREQEASLRLGQQPA